jgi:uncharacterized OsmC-like protein
VCSLKVSYDGGQHATAVNEPHHNVVAIDCPFTGKGEEFSPGKLLALSVASCMLLSMGAIAQRDDLDIKGTVVDVKIRGMEKTFPHVDAITLAFDIPRNFSETDRMKLERAAELCPVMASIREDTEISITYQYGTAKAA